MTNIYTYRELCVMCGEPTVRRTIAAWYRLKRDFSFDEAQEQARLHLAGAHVPSQHDLNRAAFNRRNLTR